MAKILVDHTASVGIIVRAKNPIELFAELKDETYPLKAFRGHLCLIGGNWIGPTARADKSPLDTFKREVEEELTLKKGKTLTEKLRLLGHKPVSDSYQVLDANIVPTKEEYQQLKEVKEAIINNCRAFGDYLIKLPEAVLDRADPTNKDQGYVCIVSYWIVLLSETVWYTLAYLQGRFQNLSNESNTIITSLPEIVSVDQKTAFGHDQPLKEFFLSRGFAKARELPLVEGISVEGIGLPRESWENYFEEYNIVRKPPKS